MTLLAREGNCLVQQCKLTRMHAHADTVIGWGLEHRNIAQKIVEREIKMMEAGALLQEI